MDLLFKVSVIIYCLLHVPFLFFVIYRDAKLIYQRSREAALLEENRKLISVIKDREDIILKIAQKAGHCGDV